jgi:hypothetical protein
VIGYYVHHQGAGHAARAGAIARRLGQPVTGLSSAPRPAGWDGSWLRLPRDDRPPPRPAGDPSAGGALHWAPLGHPGLRERMALIAGWIAAARPTAMVVDVSVEVTLLARLTGTPVATVAQPGNREDAPHQIGYQVADAILAPWPEWAEPLSGAAAWTDKLRPLGALSRFDDRPVPPQPPDRRRVVALGGTGGDGFGEQVDRARLASPAWRWTQLGGSGGAWEADPWDVLTSADVVVTHAGQNAIAEVAAARRPAIVVPQPRPHGEQQATARTLERAGLAIVCRRWPEAARWPALLDAARRLGGEGWSRWNDGLAATRAAEAIEAIAPLPEQIACAAR